MDNLWIKIYNRGSITAKALLLLPSYEVFRNTYKFLQKSQEWSKQQLKEYQLKQLNRLLEHAYKNVPYYRKVFDERDLKPGDIQDFIDLQKIPFLMKGIIQEKLNSLKAKNYPQEKFEYVTTAGSTGIPLGVFYERGVSRAIEKAFIKLLWERVGYKSIDKCVILRGNVIDTVNKEKFWRYSLLGRWLILSSYHMTEEILPKYIEKIRKFKPKFIQAYPSAITILAQFMRENNIKPFDTVKALLLGSENLYSWQRKLLKEIFYCRVFSWYGHAEQVALAGECEKSSSYHIFPEYGIVEIIGKDGKPVTQENEVGEIVGTGLNNYVAPLIRYRTMDLAVLSRNKCKCGRNYTLIKKIKGRLQELIITKTGRLISMTAVNMHSDVFDNVKQFQFYQKKKGEIIFNIVRKQTYEDRDTKNIRKELYRKLGDDIDLIIRFVNHIPRTKHGKYRFLIQELPIKFGDYYE